MKQAHKEGFLREDINSKIGSIKAAETQKEYLTLEELQTLVRMDCKFPVLKKAVLFSSLTGLRFSDIKNLKWIDIQQSNHQGGYFIKFRQQKTKGVELIPISDDAYRLLGERLSSEKSVFQGLNYSAHVANYLKTWIKESGINKIITFHCFRHTYATLQLSYGTDLYTVSKMLGHRELKTTQVYAKVIDKTKRDAADRIKLDF